MTVPCPGGCGHQIRIYTAAPDDELARWIDGAWVRIDDADARRHGLCLATTLAIPAVA